MTRAIPACARERARVQRARAAVGDERELAQVVAALHRDQAQRAQHARVGDLHDAVRGLERARGRAAGRWARRALRRAVGVDPNGPAVDPLRVQVAEHEVGVGHGGLACRPGRSRPGPGTAPALCGPTLSAPDRVHPRDASRRPRRWTRRPPWAAAPGSRRAFAAPPSRRRRRLIRHTSVVVPPMSKASARSSPSARADVGGRRHARRRAGHAPWRAGAPGPRPPTSCRPPSAAGGAARPPGQRRARRSARRGSASASGMTLALSTVVHVRSYSRNSALISLETDTWRKCGSSARRSACSCAGLA